MSNPINTNVARDSYNIHEPFSPSEESIQLKYPSPAHPETVSQMENVDLQSKSTLQDNKPPATLSKKELDPEGYKATHEYFYAILISFLLCMCGCCCFTCLPFLRVDVKYKRSASRKARAMAHMARVTMMAIISFFVCFFALGIICAIVVPSSIYGPQQRSYYYH